MKHFKRLDFVSEEIGFEVNDSRIYKTNTGAILSLILFISSFVIAIMTGSNVYKRNEPNVSVSSDFLIESKVYLQEHPFFFSVGDTNGNQYKNYSKYLNFKASKMNSTNSEVQFMGLLNTPLHKCTMDDFSPFRGKINDEILEAYLEMPMTCISFDKEAVIRNPYGSANMSFIDFSFCYCDGDDCAEDLDFVLKELYVSFYFMNAYVDSNDYNNPIKYYIDVINQRLSYGYLKRKFVRLLNNKFISDNGWLLENKETYDYMTLKDTYDEISNPSPSYPSDMYWMTIESPNIREIGKRYYVKIQDLFATVGGIINAILIIINILFSDYLGFIFKKDLAHYLIVSKKNNINNNNNIISNTINTNNIIHQSSLKLVSYKKTNCFSNVQDYYSQNNLENKDFNSNFVEFNNNNNDNIGKNDIINKDFIRNTNMHQFSSNNNYIISNNLEHIYNNERIVKFESENNLRSKNAKENEEKEGDDLKTNKVKDILNINNESIYNDSIINKSNKNDNDNMSFSDNNQNKNDENSKNSDNNNKSNSICSNVEKNNNDKHIRNNNEINNVRYSINKKDIKKVRPSYFIHHDYKKYLDSLQTFKVLSKEELLSQLNNTTYLKYVMYEVFNMNSDQSEFIKHMLTIISEKIDFFKNMKSISEE